MSVTVFVKGYQTKKAAQSKVTQLQKQGYTAYFDEVHGQYFVYKLAQKKYGMFGA